MSQILLVKVIVLYLHKVVAIFLRNKLIVKSLGITVDDIRGKKQI